MGSAGGAEILLKFLLGEPAVETDRSRIVSRQLARSGTAPICAMISQNSSAENGIEQGGCNRNL